MTFFLTFTSSNCGKDLAMKAIKLAMVLIVCTAVFLTCGCESEQKKDLRLQNDTQRKRISRIESELQTTRLQLEQLKRQLETAQSHGDLNIETLSKKVTLLEKELENKKSLIGKMQQQLIAGGSQLPVELSTLLEGFAKKEPLVTFDSARGMIKFKSDLLFERGSDVVTAQAMNSIRSLCKILNNKQAMNFDIIVAGHTDDMRIGKPSTRAKHPTNWHLSAHRAISVMNIMAKNRINSERLSVRGFGQYRPIVKNAPNQKGNPQNRRVEIYIVAKGI